MRTKNPVLDRELLQSVEGVTQLKLGNHRQAESILRSLLQVDGVDLTTASAFLRDRNPSVFRVVNRHAYRGLYGAKYPLKSHSRNSQKAALYFRYLDDLLALCITRGLRFEMADHILDSFDKRANGSLTTGSDYREFPANVRTESIETR
jgi:hypothetical protein